VGFFFGTNEIQLLLTLFYLLCGAERGIYPIFGLKTRFNGSIWAKTLSGGDFGWGDTSVKR
jgi:hypothetical protein